MSSSPKSTNNGDAHLKREIAHGSHERKARPHRSLGVVLVGKRKPECGQDAVALEMDDVAFETRLDHVAARGPVGPHELVVGLELHAAGERRGAHHVAVHEREPAHLALAAAQPAGHGTTIQTSTWSLAPPATVVTLPT
jgi:hypothetical protein